VVSTDGLKVEGTFHLNILKRKGGTFRLEVPAEALEMAAENEDLVRKIGMPESDVLARRVLLKSLVGASKKKAAQEEVLQGAQIT